MEARKKRGLVIADEATVQAADRITRAVLVGEMYAAVGTSDAPLWDAVEAVWGGQFKRAMHAANDAATDAIGDAPEMPLSEVVCLVGEQIVSRLSVDLAVGVEVVRILAAAVSAHTGVDVGEVLRQTIAPLTEGA